jgi:DNA-binding NarL/FixJ family response regulator
MSLSEDRREVVATGARIVVVDTHHDRRQLMSYVLALGSDKQASVTYADSAETAVAAVERVGADAALIEIQLPVSDGLETVERLRSAYPDLRIVVCSFHSDAGTIASVLALGADEYLKKPLRPAELYRSLRAPAAHPSSTVSS